MSTPAWEQTNNLWTVTPTPVGDAGGHLNDNFNYIGSALAALNELSTTYATAFDAAGSAAGVSNALNAHESNLANPHATTAAQVGAIAVGSTIPASLVTGLGSAALSSTSAFDAAGAAAAVASSLTTALALKANTTLLSSYLETTGGTISGILNVDSNFAVNGSSTLDSGLITTDGTGGLTVNGSMFCPGVYSYTDGFFNVLADDGYGYLGDNSGDGNSTCLTVDDSVSTISLNSSTIQHNGYSILDGQTEINLNNTNYTNSGGAGAHLILNNPNAGGQTALCFIINGSVAAKMRSDYAQNINWIAGTTGAHYFYTGGDNGVGSYKFSVQNNGNFGIGTNYNGSTLFDVNNKFKVTSAGNTGFFGVTPVAQQTGGAATAGTSYTTNEQSMINKMYTAMRNLGLIS